MPRKRIAKPMIAACGPEGSGAHCIVLVDLDLCAELLGQQQLRALRDDLGIFRHIVRDIAAIR